MINIFKNLTQYSAPGLVEISVGRRQYLTNLKEKSSYSIALAFGNEHSFATQSLAKTASAARYFLAYPDRPLIAQYAILANMPDILKNDWTIDTQTKGQLTKDIPKNSRECLEIAREIVIKEFGREYLNEANFIAHPAHMERVLGLAKKLDFKGTPFVEVVPVWNSLGGKGQDDAGATVSAEAWKKYEIKARLHHLVKGWV